LVAALCLSASFCAFAEGWEHDGVGWWYRYDNGTYPANTLRNIGGKFYGFNPSGYMYTGWAKLGGQYYYFRQSSDAVYIAGEMYYGWLYDTDGKWYYLDPDQGGKMLASQWLDSEGSRYYFKPSGAMAQNEVFGVQSGDLSGHSFEADASGAIIRNRTIKDGDVTIEYDDSGIMYFTNPTLTKLKKLTGADNFKWPDEASREQAIAEWKAQLDEAIADEKNEYYYRYKSISKTTTAVASWEADVKAKFKNVLEDSEITSYISSVKSGYYTEIATGNTYDDYEEDEWYYEDEDED
jgi:hypothetical protein